MASLGEPPQEQDPALELEQLTRALLAYAQSQANTGATGLPTASDVIVRARTVGSAGEAEFLSQPEGAPASSPQLQPPSRDRDADLRDGEPDRRSGVSASSPLSVGAPAQASRLAPVTLLTERKQRLVVLAEEVAGCSRCSLHHGRTQTVFSRGNGESGVCFVGEGPGADEDAQGEPFVGKAGQLLDRMIAAMGLAREQVYVCNIVKCRPPDNRKPEPAEAHACAPYLSEQIELIEPKVIVALGATALEGLLGVTGGITRLRGNFHLYQGRIPVMPTFHPAYLLRKPDAKREVWSDLQAVMKHVGLVSSTPGRGG